MGNIETGKIGEKLALKYLKRNKYKILEQNYYTKLGEIDIIAFDLKNEELVFVEVKARTSDRFGWPEDSITESKFFHMTRTAQNYIYSSGRDDLKYRFDAVSICLDYNTRKSIIKHFKNIGF